MSKMYVLVRTDIPNHWYVPQACHAVAQYGIDFSEKCNDWKNGTIVVKGAGNKRDLQKFVYFLENEIKIPYSCFSESYNKVGLTSVAFISEKDLFCNLHLL